MIVNITMKNFISYIWQFPQNILGIIALNIYKPSRKYTLDDIEIYYANNINGCISLGKYIIVNSKHWRISLEDSLKRDTVRHCAIGHVRQSKILGWFYLPIISIPALIARCFIKNKKKYWNFFTEKWADKLANVNRYD